MAAATACSACCCVFWLTVVRFHVCQPGQWAIVVPHDRDRPWHVDAGSVERVKEPHGTCDR